MQEIFLRLVSVFELPRFQAPPPKESTAEIIAKYLSALMGEQHGINNQESQVEPMFVGHSQVLVQSAVRIKPTTLSQVMQLWVVL